MVERTSRRTPVALPAAAVLALTWGLIAPTALMPHAAAAVTTTVTAQADARVDKRAPGSNFGTASTLIADASPVVESYVRFAVSGMSATVTKAVLRLYVSDASADGPAVYPAGNTWTEKAITWNNRPARTGPALADVGAVKAGVYVEYDVTAAVKGNGTYTFDLATPSSDALTTRSREYSTASRRPQLVLTTGEVSGDTTPPDTTITSGASGTATTRDASFTFTSSEANSTFQCRLDGGAYAACTSPMTVTGLADGSHAFDVQATDAAGNVDPSPASRSWTVTVGTVPGGTAGKVVGTVETQPVPHAGDAADDPAVWVNPRDPALSAVVGTDKLGGLAVYDLAGTQLQFLPAGNMNNVDVRPEGSGGFSLGGRSINLVVAGNRSTNAIGVYEIDPGTRQLRDISARAIPPAIGVYGSCLYRSATSGKFYVFVNSKLGEVEQWELFDNGTGLVDGAMVRSFTVGSQTEGCVADDELGHIYIGEEKRGIWKYGAEPDSGTTRTLVSAVSTSGPLVGQVEGLSLAYGPSGTGYLFASSQGNSSYAIYTREGGNTLVKTVKVVPGGGVDGAEKTDGVDVSTAYLGPSFPSGVFVVQDGTNDVGNQNFKLVPLERILS